MSVKPYAELYSKADTRRLMKEFEVDDLSIHRLGADQLFAARSRISCETVCSRTRRSGRLESSLQSSNQEMMVYRFAPCLSAKPTPIECQAGLNRYEGKPLD